MKKQKSGLYRTKIKIGVDQAGKPVYKWLSAVTRAGLEEEKRRARSRYIDGGGLAEDQLFGVYAAKWFKVRKAPHLAPGTQAVYRTILNKYILPEFGDLNLRAIRPIDIQMFLNGMAGMSGTMINTTIAALRGIFSSALQDRIIDRVPTEGLVKPDMADVVEKRALTPEEQDRLVNEALRSPDGLFVLILYYLGLRSGEARGLMWGDVDWQRERIRVERDVDPAIHEQIGELKTEGSMRTLPIPKELMDVLRARRGLPGAFIIHGDRSDMPMSRKTGAKKFSAIIKAADLPEEITPHWLRHNYATMCRDSGMKIEDTMHLLGHTSYRTTLSIYTHVTDRHLNDLAGCVESVFESCRKVAIEEKGNKK